MFSRVSEGMRNAVDFAKEHKVAVGSAVVLMVASVVLLALGAQHIHFANAINDMGHRVQVLSASTHMPFALGMLLGGGVAGGLGAFLIADLIVKKQLDKQDDAKQEKIRKVMMVAKIVISVTAIIMIAIGIAYLVRDGIGPKCWSQPVNWHWTYLGHLCWKPGIINAAGVVGGGAFMLALALPSLVRDILATRQKPILNANLGE